MRQKNGCVSSAPEAVAAVVLAAGESRRYGELKQLLDWNGQPFVCVVAQTALEAKLSPVIVVTGAQHARVRRAVAHLPVKVVYNPKWREGQSASLKVGLQALPPQCRASVFLLADQPQIPARLLCSLVETHASTGSPLVAPQVEGHLTSPVLFDRITFPDLETITGDRGGRALFERYPPHLIPWPESAIALDVDTPSDYRDLLRYNEGDE